MTRRIRGSARTLARLIFAGFCALPIHAGSPSSAAEDPAQASVHDRREFRSADPMLEEIQTVLDATRLRTAELLTRLGATSDVDEKLALQDEVESVKIGMHIRILGIQREWAERRGQQDLVTRIDHAIEKLMAGRTETAAGDPERVSEPESH